LGGGNAKQEGELSIYSTIQKVVQEPVKVNIPKLMVSVGPPEGAHGKPQGNDLD
jgi:hypothetical protein